MATAIVQGDLIGQSPKAWKLECVMMDGTRSHVWFPKSVVSYRRTEPANSHGVAHTTLEVPDYVAEGKRVDYEEKE